MLQNNLLVPSSVYCLTLEDGSDGLSRNVSNYQSMLCNIPEEQQPHSHCSRSL